MESNPWLDLPEHPPYIAQCDLAAFPGNLMHKARLHLLPAPYAGPRDAAVVLLMSHPHYDTRADIEQAIGTEFGEQNRMALTFLSRAPFYLLDDKFKGTTGYDYYAKRFSSLIEDCGLDKVRSRLILLQHFPYRCDCSARFPTLPSMSFSRSLLLETMDRDAVVIVANAVAAWQALVPDLGKYPHITLRSTRSVHLTPKNMGDAGYRRVVDALSRR